MNERLLRQWVKEVLVEQATDPSKDAVRDAGQLFFKSIQRKSDGPGEEKVRRPEWHVGLADAVEDRIKASDPKYDDSLAPMVWLDLPENTVLKDEVEKIVGSMGLGLTNISKIGSDYSGADGFTVDVPNGVHPLFISLHKVFDPRSRTTISTQDKVGLAVWEKLESAGWTIPGGGDPFAIAGSGSQGDDVVLIALDPDKREHRIQIEVKKNNAYIYDKTMQKSGGVSPRSRPEGGSSVDAVARGLARLRKYSGITDTYGLHDYIAHLRNDPEIRKKYGCQPGDITVPDAPLPSADDPLGCTQNLPGYMKDENSAGTGSLPDDFFDLTSGNTGPLTRALKDHWKNSKDQYLAVVDGADIYLWYTGFGENILAPYLGKIKEFMGSAYTKAGLRNAGSPALKYTIRAGLYVNFNLGNGLRLTESVNVGLVRKAIRKMLLFEELTKSDRKEIEKIARKQVQRDLVDKKEIEKIARKEVEAEIKKALGVSFMGHKGKINKFVVDEIQKEVQKWLKDRATKQEVADITKEVMIKVYRALSFSYRPLIDRIKI